MSSTAERYTREELLEKYKEPIKVLDHGFVRLVDVMGDDSSIVAAARVSYGKGTKTAREDRGLIRYLTRRCHTSPLEMCEIKLHMKLPIFVARQLVRHRTASLNEYSARYSELSADFYVPTEERINPQGGVSAQSSDESTVMENVADRQGQMYRAQEDAFIEYTELLAHGLARELARVVTPMGTYTQWYWKIDLHNLLHFLRLRMDAHAQWEIRQFANAISQIVMDWVPFTWEAFVDYRLGSVSFSAIEQQLLQAAIVIATHDDDAAYRNLLQLKKDLSKGEWQEFVDKAQKLGLSIDVLVG